MQDATTDSAVGSQEVEAKSLADTWSGHWRATNQPVGASVIGRAQTVVFDRSCSVLWSART